VLRGLAVSAVLLCTAGAALGQEPDWTEVRARRQADGVRAVRVTLEYMAGELRLVPADAGLLYDTHLRYDARRLRPVRRWSVEDGTGQLHMGLEGLGEDGGLDLDVDEGDHGFLEVGLSREAATELKVTVGAALSHVELGGIPLTGLVYQTGASETDLSFGEPNRERIGRLELDVGAAEFRAAGLGNARFDELAFRGGVGNVTLDFGGEWSGDASATIRMGLGSLTIVVPADLGVRIHKSGFLASLDAPGFEKVDDAWQSGNWGAARYHLDIDLVAALGSIDVDTGR